MLRVKFKVIQADFCSHNRAFSSLPLFYSPTPNFSSKSTPESWEIPSDQNLTGRGRLKGRELVIPGFNG